MRKRSIAVLALLVTTIGCYRATIDTGRQPSGTEVRNDWAHSFIAGLVPPAVVNTAAQCPNGVARVETQHSFLNMLAQLVTFSLYSPMTIRVQCAAGEENNENSETALVVPAGSSLENATRVMNEAVRRSADEGAPMLVRFE
jgi:hypothetical protein